MFAAYATSYYEVTALGLSQCLEDKILLEPEGSVSSVYLWDLEEAWKLLFSAILEFCIKYLELCLAQGYAGAFLIRKELPKIFGLMLSMWT